jgi:hypothetical protein
MILNPKEKALELVENFRNVKHTKLSDYSIIYNPTAKVLALLCVDEIIKSRKEDKNFDDTLLSKGSNYYSPHPMYLTYWLQVKEEIENL